MNKLKHVKHVKMNESRNRTVKLFVQKKFFENNITVFKAFIFSKTNIFSFINVIFTFIYCDDDLFDHHHNSIALNGCGLWLYKKFLMFHFWSFFFLFQINVFFAWNNNVT